MGSTSLIAFRGLVYAPTNEQGVVYLFGKLSEDLNMYVEIVKTGFPDCIGRRYTRRGWERIGIEFEYKSSNFEQHGHDPKPVGLPVILVCWEDDWKDCDLKSGLDQVIELRALIKDLPNKPIEAPDLSEKPDEKRKVLRDNVTEQAFGLCERLMQELDKVDEEIFPTIWKTVVTYYSPKLKFATIYFLQNGLRLEVFTGGREIDGVSNKVDHPNWGDSYLNSEADIPRAVEVMTTSLNLMKEAIGHSLDTSYGSDAGCLVEHAGEHTLGEDHENNVKLLVDAP
jgi:hypothetical protein